MTYWPTNGAGERFLGEIKIHEKYNATTHDYLHSEAASELFSIPASIIRDENCMGIVSAGCGTGHINNHLTGHNYHFMGFDTSPSVVEQARIEHPSRDFRCASWNQKDLIRVDFPVDCLLLFGVLTYGLAHYGFQDKNGTPEDIVDRLVNFYDPDHIIIRETRADQLHVAETNNLHTVDLKFLDKYLNKSHYFVDVDMWIGNKEIVHVTR